MPVINKKSIEQEIKEIFEPYENCVKLAEREMYELNKEFYKSVNRNIYVDDDGWVRHGEKYINVTMEERRNASN